MRIRVVPSAQRQIRDAVEWWRHNRPAAPNAPVEELRRAFQLLRIHPDAGSRARNAALEGTRRLHIARVNYHLYYLVVPTKAEVQILAFWHAHRGSAPIPLSE